jgi:hypothetical protein
VVTRTSPVLPPDVPLELVMHVPAPISHPERGTTLVVGRDVDLVFPPTDPWLLHAAAIRLLRRSWVGAPLPRRLPPRNRCPVLGRRPDAAEAFLVLDRLGLSAPQMREWLPRYLPALARARAEQEARVGRPPATWFPDSRGPAGRPGTATVEAVVTGAHPAALREQYRGRQEPALCATGADGTTWTALLEVLLDRARARCPGSELRLEVISRRPLLIEAAHALGADTRGDAATELIRPA